MARLRIHGFAISIDGYGARALFGDQSIIPVRSIDAHDPASGRALWSFDKNVLTRINDV